ncbi:TSC22 domain family protein 2 [Lissotriton helveticus]
MSKMPAKKKSCFQITSVTTAQATGSITEDTESLDGDPDDPRTGDVSSEVFDVSRAVDGGPDEDEEPRPAGRSSSEETLNNVGSPSTTPQPLPAAPTSSRFRVIKLDHGSGEPYRRGRWTCLEFYERESDSIRHGPSADTATDRDSGLGVSHAAPSFDQPADSSGPQAERTGQAAQQHFLVGQQTQVTGHNGIQVSQPSHFVYSQPTITSGHGLPSHPPQTEYMHNRTVHPHQGPAQQVPSNVPSTAVSSLPMGQVNHSPGCAQVGDSTVQGPMPGHGFQSHPAVIPQAGGVVQPGVPPAGLVQQKPVTQQQLGGGVSSGQHTVTGTVHNVPGGASATSVPVVPSCATPVAMPNASVTVVQSQQSGQTTVTRSASLVHPLGLPGNHVHSNLQHSNLGPSQTPSFAHTDDRRKSEPLPQPPHSLIAEHKPFPNSPMLDSLANPLHLPVTTPMNTLARSVFGISIPVDGDEDSTSNASVVAIDNKIEQAMDLVKSHLMYAVREEVEVLKEQIKELIEKNSTLERENALLKSLTNNDHLAQLSAQPANLSTISQQKTVIAQTSQILQPPQQPNVSSA